MKLTKQLPENSIFKQKRDIAINVIISTKIAPQVYKLLEIDRMFALRLFVIMRSYLFDWGKPYRENDKKAIKYYQSISDFDVISSLNLSMHEGEKLLKRKPKNEEEFKKVLNEMVNLFIFFFLENIVEEHLQAKFASEYLRFIAKFELVFGPMENENLLNYIKKLDSQNHKLSKAEETLKPDCPENDKKILTHDVSAEDSAKNMTSEPVEEMSKKQNIAEEFLTRKETAKFYDVSIPTLWRWEKKGSIPKAIRIGGKVKWLKSDINEHLKANNRN